jgi:hypothetical protein
MMRPTQFNYKGPLKCSLFDDGHLWTGELCACILPMSGTGYCPAGGGHGAWWRVPCKIILYISCINVHRLQYTKMSRHVSRAHCLSPRLFSHLGFVICESSHASHVGPRCTILADLGARKLVICEPVRASTARCDTRRQAQLSVAHTQTVSLGASRRMFILVVGAGTAHRHRHRHRHRQLTARQECQSRARGRRRDLKLHCMGVRC